MQSTRETIVLLVITASIIALVLILFVVLLLYFYQRKQIMFQENIEALKASYEKSLLNTELEIQEQTLQHISREIHDNIGLSLTLAKLNLNTIDETVPDYPSQKINESSELIGKAINDLNAISHSLNAQVISSNGLIKALEDEVVRIAKIGTLKMSMVVSGESIFLDNQKELLLFRIVQEALNNILKYARASMVRIELHYDTNQLLLKIKDNGCGFSVENKKEKNGLGLHNMRARTKLMNGQFSISSNSEGTIIDAIIPIKNEREQSAH